MAWGAAGGSVGVDDICARLSCDDPSLRSLTLLRARRFGEREVEQLAAALARNRTLTELYASGHALSPASAASLAKALRGHATLTRLCVGDGAFGA